MTLSLCCHITFYEFSKDFAIPLISLVISIGSFITALAAYNLSKKISFKKTIKEEQFEFLKQFIDEFTYTNMNYIADNIGGSNFYLDQLMTKDFKEKNTNIFEKDNLYFEADFSDNLYKLQKFLPYRLFKNETFFNLLQKLFPVGKKTFTYEEIVKKGNFIAFVNHNELLISEKKFNQTDFQNFESYFGAFIKLRSEINSWLEKHDGQELKFRS